MATSRLGSDLRYANPTGYKVPIALAQDVSFGVNTLVGQREDGYVEDIAPASSDYQMALVCVAEITGGATDGAVVSNDELVTDVIIKLEISGATVADVGELVYASDEKTVTLTEGIDGKPLVGRIVEFVDASNVYVHVDPALAAAGAPA